MIAFNGRNKYVKNIGMSTPNVAPATHKFCTIQPPNLERGRGVGSNGDIRKFGTDFLLSA